VAEIKNFTLDFVFGRAHAARLACAVRELACDVGEVV